MIVCSLSGGVWRRSGHEGTLPPYPFSGMRLIQGFRLVYLKQEQNNMRHRKVDFYAHIVKDQVYRQTRCNQTSKFCPCITNKERQKDLAAVPDIIGVIRFIAERLFGSSLTTQITGVVEGLLPDCNVSFLLYQFPAKASRKIQHLWRQKREIKRVDILAESKQQMDTQKLSQYPQRIKGLLPVHCSSNAASCL